MNVIYTALFVNSKNDLIKLFPPIHCNTFYHHATIGFKPKNLNGIEVGKKVCIAAIGRLTTGLVDVLVIELPKSTNKVPHITLSTAQGIKPATSGSELINKTEAIEYFDNPILIECTEGFFNGRDITN